MDHIVYVDTEAKELDNIISGLKTIILRGAEGRKVPYGKVSIGDILYFINNNTQGDIKVRAQVKSVYNSDKLAKVESVKLVQKNHDKLQLTDKQFAHWAGKRYLVMIEINNVETMEPFKIDKKSNRKMDDWILVGEIDKVRIV